MKRKYSTIDLNLWVEEGTSFDEKGENPSFRKEYAGVFMPNSTTEFKTPIELSHPKEGPLMSNDGIAEAVIVGMKKYFHRKDDEIASDGISISSYRTEENAFFPLKNLGSVRIDGTVLRRELKNEEYHQLTLAIQKEIKKYH